MRGSFQRSPAAGSTAGSTARASPYSSRMSTRRGGGKMLPKRRCRHTCKSSSARICLPSHSLPPRQHTPNMHARRYMHSRTADTGRSPSGKQADIAWCMWHAAHKALLSACGLRNTRAWRTAQGQPGLVHCAARARTCSVSRSRVSTHHKNVHAHITSQAERTCTTRMCMHTAQG